jgi:hypothetical protein
MTDAFPDRARLDRLQWAALWLGVVALAVCAVAGFFWPAAFFRAYLAAYHYVLGLGLGCFAILLIYHLTGGAWGFLIRRILEAGTRTLPLLAVLFLPVGFGAGYLFPWVHSQALETNPALHHQEIYLNLPFFWVRAGAYFLFWLFVTFLVNLWSRRQQRTGDPALPARLGLFAGAALVMHGIVIHFASIDWLMSLQPAFRSTIIGPLYASSQLLSAMSLAVIVLSWAESRPPLDSYFSPEALNDIGNLQFAFLVVWGYMVYFQYMLVWIANLQHEVAWFLPRQDGGWLWVTWGLVILGFVVPFFLLLTRDVKRSPRAMPWVAGLILFTQIVYAYREVFPSFPDVGLADAWMALVLSVSLIGLWLACFLWQLKGLPLVPAHDPNCESALHLRRIGEEEARRLEEIGHA